MRCRLRFDEEPTAFACAADACRRLSPAEARTRHERRRGAMLMIRCLMFAVSCHAALHCRCTSAPRLLFDAMLLRCRIALMPLIRAMFYAFAMLDDAADAFTLRAYGVMMPLRARVATPCFAIFR